MTLELVILTMEDGALRLLLGPRGLPRQTLRVSETLDEAARRLLGSEVAADHLYLEQLYTFGTGRVAYLALVHNAHPRAKGRAWRRTRPLSILNREQRRVAAYGVKRLRNKIAYTNLAFAFLPGRFTLSDLQGAYEGVLGRCMDKRNFRKKILSLGILVPDGVAHRGGRPARLYQFTSARRVVFWPSLGPRT